MPTLVVIAGPNGAGKSTLAPALLHGLLRVDAFVNADVIARGLSGFDPDGAAIQAGRVMPRRRSELASLRADFACETTLARRGVAPWIAGRVTGGYGFRLVHVWVASAELRFARVAERTRAGGHAVPDEVVRRRYAAGMRNFLRLYQPLAASWYVYDNSGDAEVSLVAEGSRRQVLAVYDDAGWTSFLRGGGSETA